MRSRAPRKTMSLFSKTRSSFKLFLYHVKVTHRNPLIQKPGNSCVPLIAVYLICITILQCCYPETLYVKAVQVASDARLRLQATVPFPKAARNFQDGGRSALSTLKQAENTPPSGTDPGIKSPVYLGDISGRRIRNGLLRNDDVLVPCSECMKLMNRYISTCALYESTLKPLPSIREFCEQAVTTDPNFTERDYDYCLSFGHKLATRTGTNFAALHTNNHVLGSCAAFQHMCLEYGGPPNCYSGFCDYMSECTDCPYAMLLVATEEEGHAEAEVCGDRGVCRLGSARSNTGYCECDEDFRGLACDQLRDKKIENVSRMKAATASALKVAGAVVAAIPQKESGATSAVPTI